MNLFGEKSNSPEYGSFQTDPSLESILLGASRRVSINYLAVIKTTNESAAVVNPTIDIPATVDYDVLKLKSN